MQFVKLYGEFLQPRQVLFPKVHNFYKEISCSIHLVQVVICFMLLFMMMADSEEVA